MPDHSPGSIPFALSRTTPAATGQVTVLAGDVGGTKTNLALYRNGSTGMEPIIEKTFHSAGYAACTDILKDFLSDTGVEAPRRLCLGVAGPVLNGKVELTNLNWHLDVEDIRRVTGIQTVALLNDLEATAYGLACLKTTDLLTLHAGNPPTKGNMAILAPGTGLGEAGLYWDGKAYHPFPTEGGHSDFAPRTPIDMDLCRYLQQKYGVASWERVISGPGIHDIYLFLRDTQGKEEPAWLSRQLQEADPSAVISETALQEKAPICTETLALFVRCLARESSNLVLKMKATGGLFLGGGIPPKIAPLLQEDLFYRHYLDCDRMQHLLQEVPIHLIRNPKTALLGAGFYGLFGS